MNYRENDPSASEVYRHPPGGLGSVGCLAIFLSIPAIGGLVNAFRNGGLAIGGIVLAAYVVIGFAVYAFFNEDATITIDGQSMRLTHQRFVLGKGGPMKLAWEIPLAKLNEAREITYHSPAKNGGWNRNTKLHLPSGITLEPAVLGGEQSSDTAYSKFVASLQRRLGPGFTRDDDFGPLTAAMKRGELPKGR